MLLQKNLIPLEHIFGSKDVLATYKSERKPDNIHLPDDGEYCTLKKNSKLLKQMNVIC